MSLLCGAGELPLFNPDLELLLPSAVVALHARILAADALLIASPEYAHGVTGTVKNILDWLVSFEPFVYKPVAVLTHRRARITRTRHYVRRSRQCRLSLLRPLQSASRCLAPISQRMTWWNHN